MAIDRTTLRRLVGDRRGDLLLLTATADETELDRLTDTVRLGDRGDNAPSINGRLLYFPGTAGSGPHQARVTSFATLTRTITFAPALSSPVVTGQEAELYLLADHLGGVDTIHRLLNAGIRAVERIAEGEEEAAAQAWDWRTGSLTIPSDWVELGGAYWTGLTGGLVDVPGSRIRVRPGTRTLELWGTPSGRAHGRDVTLWGYPASPQLSDDTDETNVDAEWLVESVIAALAIAGTWKSSDTAREERRGSFWQAQALTYRRSVAAPRRGLRIALR